MQKNNQIEFLRKKDYKFLREMGQGGTGKTILIEDEFINEIFVCKKYSPFNHDDKESYFKYFIDEIKILYSVYHKNIVRVFSYYLYPEQKTGYIIMEFVSGKPISEYLKENPDKIEDIFIQTIEGFRYLEEIKILHRDIRPENILVSEDGIVKIIDFGFGKSVDFESNNKSISLNWRYTPSNDFNDETYNFQTEIYFVGKLFEELIQNIQDITFKFSRIVTKMTSRNLENRISSFFDVYREIINTTSNENEFTHDERMTYLNFANGLVSLISKIPDGSSYSNDIDEIIRKLEQLHKNSILEYTVQNNNKLINIFLDVSFKYFPGKEFKVSLLLSFIKLVKSVSENKRKIILNNLWERFDKIEKFVEVTEDLPF